MPQKPTNETNQARPIRVKGGWLQDDATQKVFEILNREDIQTRAVGGAVRNTLLGLPASDVDFATTAIPQAVSELARAAGMSVHPTGIDHGTVTLVCAGKTFEVTTLRNDVSTDGRRATVTFTTNWEEDARRRDFTINALYCDADGTLFDPLGGYRDIESRTIRFIDEPHQRIREDYLRILRFFRFFAAYGHNPIDAAGLQACEDLKDAIQTLSGERVHAEILRLLSKSDPLSALRHMSSTGIWQATFKRAINLEALTHLIKIEHSRNMHADALLRLAVSSVRNENDASDLATRLKLSNVEANRIKRIAAHAPSNKPETPLAQKSNAGQRKALYIYGSQTYKDLCLWQWAQSGDAISDDKHIASIDLPSRWTPPELPFSGADLIARGMPPGPNIGRSLSQFESWWIENDFPLDDKLLKTKLTEFANNE